MLLKQMNILLQLMHVLLINYFLESLQVVYGIFYDRIFYWLLEYNEMLVNFFVYPLQSTSYSFHNIIRYTTYFLCSTATPTIYRFIQNSIDALKHDLLSFLKLLLIVQIVCVCLNCLSGFNCAKNVAIFVHGVRLVTKCLYSVVLTM